MRTRIPVVASVEDLPAAVEAAEQDPTIQWYVAKRAVALRATDGLPEAWQSVVAAMGGEWSKDSRKKAVKKGEAYASSSSGGSFPIRDKADLRRAVQAFGRAKDKAKAKAHIIKRARALGAVSMLPESWNIGQTASAEVEDFDVDTMRREALRLQMEQMK